MLKQTKSIAFRISSVLSKVEPEPGAGPSHRLQPKSTSSGSATLIAEPSVFLQALATGFFAGSGPN